MATLTRADLAQAVQHEFGLSRGEAADFVETMIGTIAERLAAGDPVAISGFGSFRVRFKGPRMGRNPKTRVPAPISARHVVVFRASGKLKERLGDALGGIAEGA